MRVVMVLAVSVVACAYPALPQVDGAGSVGTDPIVFLQRVRRSTIASIYDDAGYQPGARLVRLDPAAAAPVTICCDQAGLDLADIDIEGYDLSFDAQTIVFSGKRSATTGWSLFLLRLADGRISELIRDPARDYRSPIFLPGDRLLFTTTAVVEPGAAQFRDKYDGGVTTQLGRVNLDGSDLQLGPRHLGYRTAPSLASDGRIVFTQADELGPQHAGHLMFVDQDLQGLHEGYGKEGTGASNSVIRAREISPGRWIGIATTHDGTLGAGALLDIRLGLRDFVDGVVSAARFQSEANATYQLLAPGVPVDDTPAAAGVGRYHDAYPLDAADQPTLLVAWADGPVEANALATMNQTADFGIYRYLSAQARRELIFDDPARWDLAPRPLRARPAPAVTSARHDAALGATTVVGSLDVYTSTLHSFQPGEIYGVRVIEEFSTEEGFSPRFGTAGSEGAANLGVVPVSTRGTWSAKIPANIPFHLQAVDVFGISLFTESVSISGRAGEAMICGGCHEDRALPPVISTAQIDALTASATGLFATTPRSARQAAAPVNPGDIVGVAWDRLIQPILDAKCVSCHGDSNVARIGGYTISNAATGSSASWTFNLSGGAVPSAFADLTGAGPFSKSYLSLVGPDQAVLAAGGLMISGNFKLYLSPRDARGSLLIQLLNPTQLFPTPSTTRAFTSVPHMQGKGTDLTPLEFYALILAADLGGNYYARENNPHRAP